MKKMYMKPVVLQTAMLGNVVLASSGGGGGPETLPIDPTIEVIEGE